MIKRPDEYGHNNPDYAITDSDSVRGGGRVVADLAALYALSSKTDQLKVRVTRVWVTAEGKYYVLKDMTNVGNIGGWEVESTGESVEYSTDIEADKASTTKVSAIKTLYDWAVGKFQSVLVSGTNIKTINSTSILGSGDIVIETGSVDYDDLTDKPQINSVELSGNKTTTDLNLDIYTGATVPINPTEKVQWLDTTSGIKYEYVLDTWVELGPQSVSSEGSSATSHTALLDKNAEPTFQHLDTTTEKITPIDADSFGLWDSVTSTFKRLSVANMLTWFRGLPHTFTQLISFSGGIKTDTLTKLNGSGSYVNEDGGTIWHNTKWFTNSGTFSSNGTTVTTTSGQLTSAMIGAKIGTGTDKRIIVAVANGNNCTVNSAFSQNYSAVSDWGVYCARYEYIGNDLWFYSYNKTQIWYYQYGKFYGGYSFEASGIQLKNYSIYLDSRASSSIFAFELDVNPGTNPPDTGFKRNKAATWEVNNGTSGQLGDIKLRSVQVSDNTSAASIDKVGMTRYRADANNSYTEMCMQTGSNTYAWVVIKQNTWS